MRSEQIAEIREWLGTGSINIFGLPFSGRQTLGKSLASIFGAVFISGGEIVRHSGRQLSRVTIRMTNNGDLLPVADFENLILPYLQNEAYSEYPLVLNSIGRRLNEGADAADAARAGGHPIRLAIVLNVSENEARRRWEVSRQTQERVDRYNDRDERYLTLRFERFRQETEPVIAAYRRENMLIAVHGNQEKQLVVMEALQKIYEYMGR